MSEDGDAESREQFPVRAVVRAVDLLAALADGPSPITRLAEQTGLSKGTSHRLLASLAYRQLVAQDPLTNVYMLGPGSIRLLEPLHRSLRGLGYVARPIMEKTRDIVGETVALHVRMGDQRLCVQEVPSPHALRHSAGIGSSEPIYYGSTGKVLIATMLENQRQELLDALLPSLVDDLEDGGTRRLLSELEEIRVSGCAVARGERILGGAAATAAIYDPNGDGIAALTAIGPEARLPEDILREVLALVVRAAEEITQAFAAMRTDHISRDTD